MIKFIVIYIIVGLIYGILNTISERENIIPLLKELKNGFLIVSLVLLYTVLNILLGPIMTLICIILLPILSIDNLITKAKIKKL